MWEAKVARTERKGDRLDIIVHYSNGVNEYDQTISTSAVQGDTWLSDQIQDKLKQLNGLDDFETAVKADAILTSTVTEIPVDITPVSLGTV